MFARETASDMARESSMITWSDRSYGWSIACLVSTAFFLLVNSAVHALTKDAFLSVSTGVAAGLITGVMTYQWASDAKARWRNEETQSRF